jgi:peptide/nickel transport system ATP-binding protein
LRSVDPPSPLAPPSGCRFHTRCPHAEAICSAQEPPLRAIGSDARKVACHLVTEDAGSFAPAWSAAHA